MKYIQQLAASVSASTLLAVGACSGSDTVQVVFQDQYCSSDSASLRQLSSPEQIAALKPAQMSMSGESNSAEKTPSLGVNIDLARQYLVLVALGQKNTAGYNLGQVATQTQIKDKVLYLPTSLAKPSSGMVAQVITSPCAVLALDKSHFKSVRWGERHLELK